MSDFLELAILDGATPSTLSLPELEQVIERGQQTFIEVGRALLEIRDRRLYRETHDTFEAYCRERWAWGRAHVYRQMDAARVAGALSPTGDIPESEREARAMLDRLEPEEREQVRRGDATRETVERMTTPRPRPKTDTTSDAYMVEVVRTQLTRIRNEYGILAYWRPVWNAIDTINKELKR